MTDFYASYETFKSYETPTLGKKDIRRFDADFWSPLDCTTDMTMLELGCGTGRFLAYLAHKGVAEFSGLDHDANLQTHIPEAARDHFQVADIWDYLEKAEQSFDRIALFDVLEHFDASEAAKLMSGLRGVLKPGGRILVRVPNMGSPWGLQYQYGDLTHKTGYNPSSMRQLAAACGLQVREVRPHKEGSRNRQRLDSLVHGLLNKVLSTPPEIWTANFYTVFEATEA